MAKAKDGRSTNGRDEITAMAERLCRLHPDAPARTLARRLVEESGGAISINAARMRILNQFGRSSRQRGGRHVVAPVATRPPRPAGYRGPPMPASKVDDWKPAVLDVVGTVGVLSDIHVPYHDERALQAAVDALRGDRIDALVLNGDALDFYAISRYQKNPKLRNFRGEVEASRELLAWVRGQFKDIPIVFKSGNHEERWAHWLWQHAPEISDDPRMGLDQWLDMPDHGIEFVDDKRPIMAGKLPLLHGHEKGNGFTAPVNQARGAFLRLNHTVLEGHGHRTSAHCEPDMFGREVFCWSTGCLCGLHPEYARLNKWNHGFAAVEIAADGQFNVQNYRITNGKVRSS
jgi:predicted phosphodiesterase